MKVTTGSIVRHGNPMREMIVIDVVRKHNEVLIYPLDKAFICRMATTYWAHVRELEIKVPGAWEKVTGVEKNKLMKGMRKKHRNAWRLKNNLSTI